MDESLTMIRRRRPEAQPIPAFMQMLEAEEHKQMDKGERRSPAKKPKVVGPAKGPTQVPIGPSRGPPIPKPEKEQVNADSTTEQTIGPSVGTRAGPDIGANSGLCVGPITRPAVNAVPDDVEVPKSSNKKRKELDHS